MIIKIFTMVKDEVDIINDWINYYGNIFGYENLYIIDNLSTDGTYENILSFLKKNIHINVFRTNYYINKGVYMKQLIEEYANNECYCFPVDSDEFVVYYDKEKNSIYTDKKLILQYFENLPVVNLYKMNYILSLITEPEGYKRATVECNYGSYLNYGKEAKSFFRKDLYKGEICHGNHYPNNEYLLTDLCLIHFHHRNLLQMKAKIINNVSGLKYDSNNKEQLYKLLNVPYCAGCHHVKNQIEVLENRYKLPFTSKEEIINNKYINLSIFNQTIPKIKEII